MRTQCYFQCEDDSRPLSAKELIELIRAVHDRGLPFRFRAAGASMSPFIRNGDIVTVAPKESNPIRVGDVVAFVHPGTERLSVHRVIGKAGNSLLLRGDNNSQADGLISFPDVLGVVAIVERNGSRVTVGLGLEKYIIAFLSNRSMLGVLTRVLSQALKIVRLFGKEKL